MVDELHSNLEPIEEGDLDLKDKFLGGEKSSESSALGGAENKVDSIPAPEQSVERKEGSAEKEASYSKILSKIPATSPQPQDEEVAGDAEEIAGQNKDVESRITNLVRLAEVKGIPHAVKVARHVEDNYVLDELHDRLLAEELHDAMVKKGMIKEF